MSVEANKHYVNKATNEKVLVINYSDDLPIFRNTIYLDSQDTFQQVQDTWFNDEFTELED